MRDHFKALLGTMLTLQAVSAVTAVAATADVVAPPVDRVSLIEPSAIDTHSMFDTSNVNASQLVSTHTRSATADVMNLPAEPIPTPPAFAMGMTVILGLVGFKAVRRLRLA